MRRTPREAVPTGAMPTRVTRDAFSGTPTPTGLGVVRRDARRRDASPRRARASAFARARAPVRRDARRARARPISAARRPWRRTRTRRGLRAPGKTPPARLARGLITDPPSVDASARGARAPGHDAPRAGSRGRGAGNGGRASRAAHTALRATTHHRPPEATRPRVSPFESRCREKRKHPRVRVPSAFPVAPSDGTKSAHRPWAPGRTRDGSGLDDAALATHREPV